MLRRREGKRESERQKEGIFASSHTERNIEFVYPPEKAVTHYVLKHLKTFAIFSLLFKLENPSASLCFALCAAIIFMWCYGSSYSSLSLIIKNIHYSKECSNF